MSHTILMGSCLCGAVKYEVAGEAKRFYHCHCSRCRKATGTGHASNLFLQPATLTWLVGQEHVRAFKVPEAAVWEWVDRERNAPTDKPKTLFRRDDHAEH